MVQPGGAARPGAAEPPGPEAPPDLGEPPGPGGWGGPCPPAGPSPRSIKPAGCEQTPRAHRPWVEGQERRFCSFFAFFFFLIIIFNAPTRPPTHAHSHPQDTPEVWGTLGSSALCSGSGRGPPGLPPDLATGLAANASLLRGALSLAGWLRTQGGEIRSGLSPPGVIFGWDVGAAGWERLLSLFLMDFPPRGKLSHDPTPASAKLSLLHVPERAFTRLGSCFLSLLNQTEKPCLGPPAALGLFAALGLSHDGLGKEQNSAWGRGAFQPCGADG